MAGLTGLLPKNTYQDLIQLNNGGTGVPATLQRLQDGLGNNTGMALSTTQIGIAGTDVGIKRLAALVAAMTDGGGTNLGWLQEAGYAALAAPFTRALATLAVTNLSIPVIAGRSYQISGVLQVSNSTATEGSQFDFAGGSCSATTFFMAFNNVGAVVAGTVTSTTLAGVLNYTTNTGTDYIMLAGYLKANLGGTFILRAAENTTAVGTLTIGAGSWLALTDTPTL
jgi:hypothetical protein